MYLSYNKYAYVDTFDERRNNPIVRFFSQMKLKDHQPRQWLWHSMAQEGKDCNVITNFKRKTDCDIKPLLDERPHSIHYLENIYMGDLSPIHIIMSVCLIYCSYFYYYYFVDLAKLSSFHKINNSHDDAFAEFVRKVALMTEFPLCLGSSSSSHQFQFSSVASFPSLSLVWFSFSSSLLLLLCFGLPSYHHHRPYNITSQ